MAPMQELTHDKNRLNVCILCYRKGKRSLSGKEIELIREFIIGDYDVENPCFPDGICEGYHFLLNFNSNGMDVMLPNVDYETLILPQLLCSFSTTPCNCLVCLVATLRLRMLQDGWGYGFLKICLSIFDLNQPCSSTRT